MRSTCRSNLGRSNRQGSAAIPLINGRPRGSASSRTTRWKPSPGYAGGESAPQSRQSGLGLGIANSMRAMVLSPEFASAWRAYWGAVRQEASLGRDILLQVSFAVSNANGCRYCTIHQVLGLRRLGVDPVKLLQMKKDDSALTPRELVAVRFARKLTTEPASVTDADYATLQSEFGERGAMEVVLQTCAFAFMNRFTDGLRLPSEDEAIRVYREVYGPTSE